MGVTFRVDTREFDRTLAKYREYSRRDPETIVNTKAFYIARRASVETLRAPAAAIRKYVAQDGGEIAGKIINKRRGAMGEKGLWGVEMAKAIATMLAARLRSRAFLASGWLPAIKKLAPLAERPGSGSARGARQYGNQKGDAKPATEHVTRCIIENTAAARWDKGGQGRIGMAALKKAFDFETRSMKEYILRKIGETAKKAGIKIVEG